MVEELCSLVNSMVESRWPDDLMLSYIMPLFKAGDEEVAGNYRRIALRGCGKSDDKGVSRLAQYAFRESNSNRGPG